LSASEESCQDDFAWRTKYSIFFSVKTRPAQNNKQFPILRQLVQFNLSGQEIKPVPIAADFTKTPNNSNATFRYMHIRWVFNTLENADLLFMPSSAAAFRFLGAGKRDSLDGAMAVDLRLKEKVEILKTDAYLLILIESSLSGGLHAMELF